MLVYGLVLWGILSACTTAQSNPSATSTQNVDNQELVVFAAASLTDAFTEIGRAFAAENPATAVTFNFGSSSQLATQLIEGGPADLFASANERQMALVVQNGRIAPTTAVPFASNQLTIVVPANNPAAITRLEDLARPGILLVLAMPGVPVRDYTDSIVARLLPPLQEGFYANLVSEEENVRQVLVKIVLGEADAALVYTSDITPDIANQVQQIAIPAAQNETATYPLAPLTDSPQADLANQFIAFVLSPTGQSILAKWGFGPP
jgi:molybdate transport system substrate-binding protein